MGNSAPQANILQFHDEYLSCRVERWRVGKPMAGRTQIWHLKYFWHPDDRWSESLSGSDVTAGSKLGHHTWFRWFVKLCRGWLNSRKTLAVTKYSVPWSSVHLKIRSPGFPQLGKRVGSVTRPSTMSAPPVLSGIEVKLDIPATWSSPIRWCVIAWNTVVLLVSHKFKKTIKIKNLISASEVSNQMIGLGLTYIL